MSRKELIYAKKALWHMTEFDMFICYQMLSLPFLPLCRTRFIA